MIVILAEKSSAAKNFAKALGGMTGEYNGEKYRIVHAVGHIYGFPKDTTLLVDKSLAEKYKEWKMENLPWDPNDFKWIIKPDPTKKDIINNIKDAFSSASEVVIGTDNDPSGEGDLLAWEILLALKWTGRTSRMLFADESPKQVQKAFKNRQVVESAAKSGAFLKANARSKFDYLSMQLTRIASLQAKEKGHRMLIRQGRLKSVMVYMIGYQLDLVKNYKRVPFYEARYKDENGHVYKRKEDTPNIRFDSPDKINISDFKDSKVIHDRTERKSKAPGKLLDLAALTSTLVGKYGYDPKQIVDTYQKMYEQNIVSYPRTEDKAITKEQYEELKANRERIANAIGVDTSLLKVDTLRKKHFQESAAHGANRPGSAVPGSIEEVKKAFGDIGAAIYEILARNALALFGEDYIYDHQIGHIEDHPEFIGIANIPVSEGYKKIFSQEDSDEESEEGDSPLGEMASAFIYEGANPKPKNPSMSWLVKGDNCMLSKYNVGTGATRTSTLIDITDNKDPSKQLVKMTKKGSLSLTKVGEYSYTLLKGCYISSPKVTEHLFSNMEEVGTFKRDPESVIQSITPIVIHDMEVMKKNAANIPQGNDTFNTKEKIKGNIYKPTGEEIAFNKEWGGHSFTEDEVKKLLSGEEISFKAKSKDGKEYDAVGRLEKQKYKGKTFWGFKLKERELPDRWCGHVFSEDETADLLAGVRIHAKDFVSQKSGKTFECGLEWKKGKLTPIFKD